MIKYVCVSDLHFGAATSLMTYLHPNSLKIDPQKPSAALVEWVNCLEEILSKTNPKGSPKPTLILNGDIMELALSNTNETAMSFDQFIRLIFPSDKSPEEWLFAPHMVFLPGNHDHHLWEKARETQYTEYIKTLPIDESLPIPWHVTNMYKSPPSIPCDFMNGVIHRYPILKEANVRVSTMYPNYMVTNENQTKGIVFSHGHYIESLYMLMSELKTMIFPDRLIPQNIWDIEAENFAWIDFFWSTMGRSGEVGKDVEIIYNKMQDKDALLQLTNNMAESIAERMQKNVVKEVITEHSLKWILGELALKVATSERGFSTDVLDEKTKKGLKEFVERPLLLQMKGEIKQIPSNLSFIFGHTHKPFEKMMVFDGFPQAVKVYNDGGWVVDTIQEQKYHGGAIILVDDNLDCVSVRMYNEGTYKISTAEAKYDSDTHSEFFNILSSMIDCSQEPYASLCKTMNEEVRLRYKYLDEMVKS